MSDMEYKEDGEVVEWDRDAFFQAAARPEFPDEMLFEIARKVIDDDPEVTFSAEALNGMVDQMSAFVYARLLARFRNANRGPRQMRLHLKVSWDDADAASESKIPWWENHELDGELLSKSIEQTIKDMDKYVPLSRRKENQ